MQIRATFFYINELAELEVDYSTASLPSGSNIDDGWDYPLANVNLRIDGSKLHIGWLSAGDVLGLINLPIRKRDWDALGWLHWGDCRFRARPSSAGNEIEIFQSAETPGAPLARIAFTDMEADVWAGCILNIVRRLRTEFQV